MLEINLTNGSQANLVNLMRTESSIESHMELSLYKSTCNNKTLKKTVLVFVGYEYCIRYFDLNTGCTKTITGLVESITGDNSNTTGQYITVKYYDTTASTTSDDADVSVIKGLPKCGCIFNKPSDDKYNTPVSVDIPISNITDISYAVGQPTPCPVPPKKGVIVVLLGISAEILRAVVINLKLIDDGGSCAEEAVRDVNLKVGNIYTIAYFSSNNKAMYEFDGKLVSIQETDQAPSTNSIVRATNEQYGLNNSIYNSNCTCVSTDDADQYICANALEKDVLLTFDTSTDFSGEYLTIALSWIRDCVPIAEYPDVDEPSTGTGDNDDPTCTCGPIEMASGETAISINPMTGEVEYTKDNIKNTITLQEIMDFYFGGC